MMMNLFSQFDPMCLSNYQLLSFWFLMMSVDFMILISSFWILKSNMEFMYHYFAKFLILEFKINFKNMELLIYLILMLFLFILNQNLISLFPFNFSVTSHISFSFSVAVWLIFSMNMMFWINKPCEVMITLLPSSTPLMLIMMMVLIETISDLIRPLTLSVRLSANLTAGHLILSILSKSGESSLFFFGYIVYLLILFLEISVAVIQSYVICLLISLYLKK